MDTNDITPTIFGIGQPVSRSEDCTLVQGSGCYTDDLGLPRQVHGAFVRSPYAHGLLREINITPAKPMLGVLAIYTGADLESADYGSLPCAVDLKGRSGEPMRKPAQPALAGARVRYLGQPVALVVAETALQARDAAEAITLRIDPLPALPSAVGAAAPDAILIHDDVPGNQGLDYQFGDPQQVTEALITSLEIRSRSPRPSRALLM